MTTIGQCPTCGTGRNAQVIAEHEEIIEPTEEPFDPTLKGGAYRILKCAGCNTVYFQQEKLVVIADELEHDYSAADCDLEELRNYVLQCKEIDPEKVLCEETTYWPVRSPARPRPDWRKLSDRILIDHLSSVYAALEHDLRVLGSIGMRIVFDRASELIGIDPSKSFAKKLDQLHEGGHIGAAERESLEVLIHAGGAAAHRGWEPDLEQLTILVSIMEHFVGSFILKQEAGKLKGLIPPRQKSRTSDDGDQSPRVIELRPPKL